MADIDRSNYRAVAEQAIATYSERGVITDCLFWSFIVSQYEQDLAAMFAAAVEGLENAANNLPPQGEAYGLVRRRLAIIREVMQRGRAK